MDGCVKCKNRFVPFVKKNDELPLEHSIRKDFGIFLGEGSFINFSLYATENDEIPRYIDSPGVQCIGWIRIPVPNIPNPKKELVVIITRMHFGQTEVYIEAELPNGEKHEIRGIFDAIDKYDS